MNLHELSTVEVISELRARSFSVVELVQALLARISVIDYFCLLYTSDDAYE